MTQQWWWVVVRCLDCLHKLKFKIWFRLEYQKSENSNSTRWGWRCLVAWIAFGSLSFKFGSDWKSRSLKIQIGCGGGSGSHCDNKARYARIGIWFGFAWLGCSKMTNLGLHVNFQWQEKSCTT